MIRGTFEMRSVRISIFFFVLLLSALGCSSAPSEGTSNPTPTHAEGTPIPTLTPVQDVAVSSKQLSKSYSEDSVAAEYQYEGKLAEIKGKVVSKEKKGGLYEISLAGAGSTTGNVVARWRPTNLKRLPT